jgi:hypothetical protein
MKSSLEKSHSKASNFKLTLICLLTALGASVAWLGVCLIPHYQTFGIILASVGGVVALLFMFLIGKFTR